MILLRAELYLYCIIALIYLFSVLYYLRIDKYRDIIKNYELEFTVSVLIRIIFVPLILQIFIVLSIICLNLTPLHKFFLLEIKISYINISIQKYGQYDCDLIDINLFQDKLLLKKLGFEIVNTNKFY